ncbi:MAG: MBL fold metallo-hydrolase, partial [Candidatus Bathyarchaeota archaeon]|nr:MBL fold metallo-hydrolase [Candidatus Bathyarchaeota archaeon]
MRKVLACLLGIALATLTVLPGCIEGPTKYSVQYSTVTETTTSTSYNTKTNTATTTETTTIAQSQSTKTVTTTTPGGTTTITSTVPGDTATITETATITVTETITITPTNGSEDTLNDLMVHFIDVGQGDAILIDLDDIEVLIDGGDRSPGVIAYLNDYVDGALEVVVATHPHADHIGGLIEVLEYFDVEEVWHSGDDSTSITYSDFITAVNAEGATVHDDTRCGDIISAGDLSFTVLHPSTLDGSTNNNSIVLSLSWGTIDFLFAGDAEQEAEADMMASGVVSVPDVEILKVGHHGSNTASSPAFLAATSPETAIYMAG